MATAPEILIDMTATEFAAYATLTGWKKETIDELVRKPLYHQTIFVRDAKGNSKRVRLIDDFVTPLR
jgi:hypothetical protein